MTSMTQNSYSQCVNCCVTKILTFAKIMNYKRASSEIIEGFYGLPQNRVRARGVRLKAENRVLRHRPM